MDIWVFGYGSLVYRPGFDHAETVEGYIQGFRRVFWQGSTDHRGTPEAPGRTVTLQPDPQATTWGVAYRLAGSHEQQQETLQYLEWREKQYDRRVHVDIFTRSSGYTPAVQGALVYLATDGPQNVNWLGPAPLQDIAQQVATAAGPSGPNYEYVFSLADAMRKMEVHDVELFELETLVRALLVTDPHTDVSSSVVQQQQQHALEPPEEHSEGLEKPSAKAQHIQLTAVAAS